MIRILIILLFKTRQISNSGAMPMMKVLSLWYFVFIFLCSCTESMEDKVKKLSDEIICKAYTNRKNPAFAAACWQEIHRRTKTRLDSIVDGTEYHTIIEKPPCGMDRMVRFNGDKLIIAQTKAYVKEEKKYQAIQTKLNGAVMYHYKKNNQGKWVKDNIHKLNEDHNEGSYYIHFNNDTIVQGQDFIAFFAVSENLTSDHEFSVRQGTNTQILQPVSLKYYKHHDLDNYYKYIIKTNTLGINTLNGVFRVLEKRTKAWKEVPVNFNYVVVEENAM